METCRKFNFLFLAPEQFLFRHAAAVGEEGKTGGRHQGSREIHQMPDVLPQHRFAASEQKVLDATGGAFTQNILPCCRIQFRFREFWKFMPHAIAEWAVKITAGGNFKNKMWRQLKHAKKGSGATVIALPCQRAVVMVLP